MATRSGISLPSGAPVVEDAAILQDAPIRVDEKVSAPRYRVAGIPYYNGQALYGVGDEIVHVDEPGPNLEPLNDAAKAVHEPLMKALNDDSRAQSKPKGMIAYAGATAPSAADDIAELKRRLAEQADQAARRDETIAELTRRLDAKQEAV